MFDDVAPVDGNTGGVDEDRSAVSPDPHRLEARVRVGRVYDEPTTPEYRVLVDRLWPRGIRKEVLTLDEWAKDVAPTGDLRRWYGHDPARFAEFRRRYRGELRRAPAADALVRLAVTARQRPLLLLTATRDVEHSAAVVLAQAIAADTPDA